jgi:uncharacterized cupredoxin-like copper-binding protein
MTRASRWMTTNISRRRGFLQVLAGLGIAASIPISGAVAADWEKAEVITVVATENVFTPSSFVFRKGVAYRLHVENHGKELHEFASPEFFRSVQIDNPAVLNADRTEIDVQPGEQKDLLFVAETPGSFKLTCPDHDWAGMIGDITILP